MGADTKVLQANWQPCLGSRKLLAGRAKGIPSEAAVIRLVGAALADMHDEWQADDRRYLSEGSMAHLFPERDTDPVADLNPGD